MSRSGLRYDRQVDRWDGSAKSGVGHVTGHARQVSVGRHVSVEIHELAKRFYQLGSSVLQGWRLTSKNGRPQGVPPREHSALDEIHLTHNPFEL
jgi:hypothetical protein